MNFHTATSRDLTEIAFETTGSGPDLLLVHGTTAERSRWAPVLPALAAKYTVHIMDRRGRGGSGDTDPYDVAREFEDVAAVADAIGNRVAVVGHSFGAICALEAARLTGVITALVLYEPPIAVGDSNNDFEAHAGRLDDCIAVDDRDGALVEFYRGVLRAPEAEIATLKAQGNWPKRMALAHTIPRELRAALNYRFDATCFTKITQPTLLMLGSDSPGRFSASIELLQISLSRAHVCVLGGQQHQAINMAPSLFINEVLHFLGGFA